MRQYFKHLEIPAELGYPVLAVLKDDAVSDITIVNDMDNLTLVQKQSMTRFQLFYLQLLKLISHITKMS